MSDAPSVVLNARAVARTISRLADEILELNDGTDRLVLVGIQRRGVQIAERLAEVIREREGVEIARGALDITLYRDDLQTVGPPARIMLAVLVDRGGRELPIQPDVVGKQVEVRKGGRVDVFVPALDGRDEVVVLGGGASA